MQKVGADNTGREDRMAENGIGIINENGEMIAYFCGLNIMIIGGTIFATHKDVHKYTWISTETKTKKSD